MAKKQPPTTDKKEHTREIIGRFIEVMNDTLNSPGLEKVTKKSFGDSVGMNDAVISRIKNWYQWNGTYNGPSVEAIWLLCDTYNINANWLISGEGEKYKNQEPKKDSIDDRLRAVEKAVMTMNRTLVKWSKT